MEGYRSERTVASAKFGFAIPPAPFDLAPVARQRYSFNMSSALLIAVAALGNPPDRIDALARYGTARLQQQRGDLPAAVRNLEAARKADPTATAPTRELVTLYAELGRDAAAIRVAEAVLAADPTDADTGHALGRLLFAAKRYRLAGDVLARAAESPKLANRATKKLAVLRDVARCRESDRDWPAADAALVAVESFLTTAAAGLRKDGFAANELDRMALDIAERLGRVRTQRKQFPEAVAAYRRAAALAETANDPAAAARLPWHLSKVLAGAGDHKAALVELTKFLAQKPDSPEPFLRWVEWKRKTDPTGDVLTGLRTLQGNDPRNRPLRWVIATELLTADAPGAVAELAKYAGETADPRFHNLAVSALLASENANGLLLIADQLFEAARGKDGDLLLGDRTAAGERSAAFSDAVAAHPQFLPALLQTAGQTASSRRPETLELLAWAAERSGKLEEAEAMLQAAMRTDAADKWGVPQALLGLLAKQRKWEEIIAVCRQARNQRTAFFLYQEYQGIAYAELGRLDTALGAIQSLQVNSRYYYYETCCRVYAIVGQYAEMETVCRKGMEDIPEQARAMRMQLANALLGQKKFAAAEAEYRAMLEHDPDDVLALNNLGYHLADQGRKLDEAEAMIRRAVELDRDERARAGFARPEHASYLDSLGWVLFRRGKLAEARTQLEKAATLPDGNGDGTVWDHLGDVCYRLGDVAAAKAAWAKAAARFENSHVGRENDRLAETRRKLAMAR